MLPTYLIHYLIYIRMFSNELLPCCPCCIPFLLYATAAAIALSDCALLSRRLCLPPCLLSMWICLSVCAFDCLCVRFELLWPLVR